MTGKSVKELWENYLQGTSTIDELEQLRQYFNQPQYRAAFDELLQQAFTDPRHAEPADYNVDEMVSNLMVRLNEDNIPKPVVRSMQTRRWFWAAASLLLLAGSVLTFRYINRQPAKQQEPSIAVKEDLPPGGEGAILTLSDGSQVNLDSLRNGLIAHQNGSDVKLDNGRLLYDANQQHQHQHVVTYNTMSTPRGRQFSMILPDGSKVWLNAASSIRFPVIFSGAERKVEVTGEAYIEVKKNAARPFVVEGNDFVLQVLGTGFNINSYPENGAVKATLVEGSVKLNTSANSSVLLKPGEQWEYNQQKGIIRVIHAADIDHVLAWKQKRFSFNGNFRGIMNEIARWYDVELKYEGNIPDKELEGGFTREKELQKVLEILRVVAGVEFELKGKLLTIRATK